MPGAFALLLVLVGSAPGLAHADRIWRYVDANGHVVYANQPPKGEQSKARVIDTPHYAPPARWTGPSWGQVFGDESHRSIAAGPSASAGLPSSALNTAENGPLPPGLGLPPAGTVRPLPPLPGAVSPPVHLPWPTITPGTGVRSTSTGNAEPPPLDSGVVPPLSPTGASRPVVASSSASESASGRPVAPQRPKASSHPASAPVAAHSDPST